MTRDGELQAQANSAFAHMAVVRGSVEPEELAALVAATAAMAQAVEEESSDPRSAWMDKSRSMRGRRTYGPLGRGDMAWRHSLR